MAKQTHENERAHQLALSVATLGLESSEEEKTTMLSAESKNLETHRVDGIAKVHIAPPTSKPLVQLPKIIHCA